jgi:hypothetical protein
MQMETKFLRLRTPVELGSRFGEWQVCWLGGWARFRLHFLVMLVKVDLPRAPVAGIPLANRTIHLAFGGKRAMNGVAMNTFTIDTNNNITAFASLDEARAAKIHNAEYFGSPQELAKLVASASHKPRRSLERFRRCGSLRRTQASEEIYRPQGRRGAHLGGGPGYVGECRETGDPRRAREREAEQGRTSDARPRPQPGNLPPPSALNSASSLRHRLKPLPRGLPQDPIHEHTRGAGLPLNLAAQFRLCCFDRSLAVQQPGTLQLNRCSNLYVPISGVIHARFLPFGRRERLVEFWITGFHNKVIGHFANVGKFDRPGVTQPEIEHAVRHTRERRLLRVSPLVEQFNRITLRISAHD